jgi:RND family efflux transporter MFP subunit
MSHWLRSALLCISVLLTTSAAAQQWFTVAATPQPQWLELPSRVEAVAQATISSQTSGRIVELPFDVNDVVAQGAVIVRFTDVEQRARFNQAEAALSEAQTRRDEASKELERIAELRDQGLVAISAFDNAKANFDGAVARVQQAQAALAAATEQLEQTVVRAPYAGIVQQRFVEVGELASPGTPLLRGLSLEDLRMVSQLPQSQLQAASNSPAVALRLADNRIVELGTADITVAPEANSANHSFQLRVQLPPADYSRYALYPGSWARLRLQVGEQAMLIVPKAAVLWRGEVSSVWLQSSNGVVLQPVRVKSHAADSYQVLSGLQAGQTIAADGLAQLQRSAKDTTND